MLAVCAVLKGISGGSAMRRRLIGLLVATALTLGTAGVALGISYGEIDEDNVYSNVGALIVDLPDDDPDQGKVVICSGTLIAPDKFLTAAHCVAWADPDTTWWVSFDQTIIEPVTKSSNTIYAGKAYWHEKFACCGASDTFDIAVVDLNKNVSGVTPAGLPTENQLGEMSAAALKAATFVAAGYGTVRETRKGAWQPLFWDPQRRFAEQTANSLTGAWFTLSMNKATGDGGTCYGDSGGPHFLNGTVVSITVTGDVWCKAADKTYRVDTPVARDFLDDFVILPE
jgi:secreted trypsin-like serine protease